MFTAMAPKRKCQICQYANDGFAIVAHSFRYSEAYSNKIFFATVDFDEATDVFHLVNKIILKYYFLLVN